MGAAMQRGAGGAGLVAMATNPLSSRLLVRQYS